MKEYKATLHGYKIVTPPRCKLERLEPATEEITLPLHYADNAPVAMRVAGPLEYVGRDGNTYTWRGDGLELLALDGMLWKPYNWRDDEEWTIERLASLVDEHNVLERWPWQWRNESEPPTGLLVRERGKWATIDNRRAALLEDCDRYAVIAGKLYEPAQELVYTYKHVNEHEFWGHKTGVNRTGSVIVAEEYEPGRSFTHYLCNALQDWREVNVYDEHTERYQDKIMNEVTGVDVIEVLLPEYVNTDPYADFWREEIARHEEKAANCKQAAKEHDARARQLREDAKRDREAAAREVETARKLSEKLEAYLSAKEA